MSPRSLSDSDEYGVAVYYACGVPIRDICEKFGLSRSAVHRLLARLGVETDRNSAFSGRRRG